MSGVKFCSAVESAISQSFLFRSLPQQIQELLLTFVRHDSLFCCSHNSKVLSIYRNDGIEMDRIVLKHDDDDDNDNSHRHWITGFDFDEDGNIYIADYLTFFSKYRVKLSSHTDSNGIMQEGKKDHVTSKNKNKRESTLGHYVYDETFHKNVISSLSQHLSKGVDASDDIINIDIDRIMGDLCPEGVCFNKKLQHILVTVMSPINSLLKFDKNGNLIGVLATKIGINNTWNLRPLPQDWINFPRNSHLNQINALIMALKNYDKKKEKAKEKEKEIQKVTDEKKEKDSSVMNDGDSSSYTRELLMCASMSDFGESPQLVLIDVNDKYEIIKSKLCVHEYLSKILIEEIESGLLLRARMPQNIGDFEFISYNLSDIFKNSDIFNDKNNINILNSLDFLNDNSNNCQWYFDLLIVNLQNSNFQFYGKLRCNYNNCHDENKNENESDILGLGIQYLNYVNLIDKFFNAMNIVDDPNNPDTDSRSYFGTCVNPFSNDDSPSPCLYVAAHDDAFILEITWQLELVFIWIKTLLSIQFSNNLNQETKDDCIEKYFQVEIFLNGVDRVNYTKWCDAQTLGMRYA